MILVESDQEDIDISESVDNEGLEAYLVEPLRSSVVTKFTGTLGSSGATDKLTSTILAFSHFVMENTACLLAFADLQGACRYSFCLPQVLTQHIQAPVTRASWCYLIQ